MPGIHQTVSVPTRLSAVPVQGLPDDSALCNVPLTLHQFANESTSSTTPRELRVHAADFVVVGSGIAGLSYALKVADYGEVAIVTKGGMLDGCTAHAQGGVCAVLDPLDTVESHVHDTRVAGNFLNDERYVQCPNSNADLLQCDWFWLSHDQQCPNNSR